MERLFESLAENVSEACYDEIIGIVEDLVSQIKKVHGEPRFLKGKTYTYKSKPLHGSSEVTELPVPAKTSKSAQKINKVNQIRHDEEAQANIRGIESGTDYANQATLNRHYTKNIDGEEVTDARRKKPVPNMPGWTSRRTTGPRQRFGAKQRGGKIDPTVKSEERHMEKAIKKAKSPNVKTALKYFAKQKYEEQGD